jgi:hypothetical protein
VDCTEKVSQDWLTKQVTRDQAIDRLHPDMIADLVSRFQPGDQWWQWQMPDKMRGGTAIIRDGKIICAYLGWICR